MFTNGRKSGKKGSRPGTAAKGMTQKLGSPYWWRHDMGGDETRERELGRNDYGKKAQKTDKVDERIPVSPRRTIIHGR